MKLQTLSFSLLSAGVVMLAVHQFTKAILFQHINDGILRHNILEDLVEVFALSLLLVAFAILLLVGNAGYEHMKSLKEKK